MHTLKDIMTALKGMVPCAGGRGCPLPATGQTKSYEGIEIDCASASQFGQDGSYQAGCPAAGRFTDNGDGTVTDNCTGLMWQKETPPAEYMWDEAIEHCENLELAGHTEWRLPNIRELQSIVDCGRFYPAIDPVFGGITDWYWSSTTDVSNTEVAWYVRLDFGSVGNEAADGLKGYPNYALAVRSGQ